MAEKQNNLTAQKQQTLMPVILLFIIAAATLFFVWKLWPPSRPPDRPPDRTGPCMANLHTLALVLKLYSDDHSEQYPPPNKWCDVLSDYWKIISKDPDYEKLILVCPAAGEGRCHYAINPNATPNSPPDTVLFFETKDGWNQFGGPEILTTENHTPKGCMVTFADTNVRLVPELDLAELNWGTRQDKK